MEWFKEELFLIPNWAWFVIIIGIGCILAAIVIIACVRKGDKKENPADPVLMPAEEAPEAGETKAEEVKEEEVTAPAEPEPVPVEDEPVAKKPAAKKKTTAAKKEEPKAAEPEEAKPAAKTTATKTAAKTTATKSAATKTAAKPAAAKPAAKAVSADDVKVYHISKRTDKKWEVRLDGGDKALKLFFTQKEAIDYVRKVSGKKKIIVHKEDGTTREV